MKLLFCLFCLVLVVNLDVCFAPHPSMATDTEDDCSLFKCNETDPNCDVIGRGCKDEYRMCCDGICRVKQRKCGNSNNSYTNSPMQNGTNSNVLSMNQTTYKKYFEDVKKMILAYAATTPCWPEYKCINKTTCKPEYKHCTTGKCVQLLSECNFWFNEQDYLADKNTTCYPEERCFRNRCLPKYWMCDNGECVYQQLVCRGGPDCSDGSDEIRCSGKCYPPFRCLGDKCKFGFHRCGNGECILQEQVCDAVNDCHDGSDEMNCTSACYPKRGCNADGSCKIGYFRCDKAKCIPDSSLCDQRANCKDGTDEIRSGPGFKCVLGSNFGTCALSQDFLEDDIPKCADHADQCVVNGTNRCFTCLDQRLVIGERQRCDGVFDCYDLSDECLCGNSNAEKACKAICLDINANSTVDSFLPNDARICIPETCNCSVGEFDCGNGVCLKRNQVCNGINECGPRGLDERFCEAISNQNSLTIMCPGDVDNKSTIKATMCDGRPECHDLSDECNSKCDTTPRFCHIKTLFSSESGPYEFLCDGKSLFFDARAICDGIWTDCVPHIEEEELDCPARHYCPCKDAISIDKNLLCDGIPQCDDKSDEKNCENRFYCESESPFSVPMSKKLDGKRDCSDYSDECPKEMDQNALSSRRELLGSIAFRAATWIIGTLAFAGNIVTFVGAAKSLIKTPHLNPVSKINYIFLLNLSIADCLMGFYLIVLSIKSLQFSGEYCMHNKAWKSSNTCSGLGSLALTSSQASVLILVCLTTLRLYSVLNPTKTKGFSIAFPIATMVAAWFFSLLIALLPTASCLSDYFVSEAWMPTNVTAMETRNKSSQIIFVHRLRAVQPVEEPAPTSTSWDALHGFLERNYPEIKIKGYFGYFSDNSVCLPKFFVSVGESGWEYSFVIILFNFLAFFYVCIAYWIIFKASSKRQIKRMRSKQLISLQKRVARLVITDFFCWIPICLMSFVHLGGNHVPDFAYAFSAVILLPINSAINPFLYSNTLAEPLEKLYTKILGQKNVCDLAPCSTKSKKLDRSRSYEDDYTERQSEETEERAI